MAAVNNNQAAWLGAAKANPLEVRPGPDQSTCESDEVIIKVSYVAINPVDWKIQDYDFLPLAYPIVLGTDVAGEIVHAGDSVTKFKSGDRVIGHCLGLVLGGSKHGAFQHYATCREAVVAKIPEQLPFSEATVLPLSISTAAVGLFELLGLDLPSTTPNSNGKMVLIWGGSSSCGSTAIQLASAAGYTVVTTASTHNHDYVKSLGASHAFDHNDPQVTQKINAVVQSKLAGVLDCISDKFTQQSCSIVLKMNGGGKLAILLGPETDVPGVELITVNASTPATSNKKLGEAIWGQYVPAALATGKLVAKPEPYVIRGGLSKIQEAMNVQRKGVSAKKVVVEM